MALELSNSNYDKTMTLFQKIRPDLLWWRNAIPLANNSIILIKIHIEIFSDASLSGWGVTANGLHSHGFWDLEEQDFSIHILELKAASLRT